MKKFIENWKEMLIWVPVSMLVLYLCYWLLPGVDPLSGIDGFGDLFMFSIQVLKVVTVFYLTWVFKKTYFYDLSSSQETDLQSRSMEGSREYERVIIRDRLEFLSILVIVVWVLL